MHKNRTAARVDGNQEDIISALRTLPGITVETGHDDILVGYNLCTYWFEIKDPGEANNAGQVFESKITRDQKRIRRTFTGQYNIVTTKAQILDVIGYPIDEI